MTQNEMNQVINKNPFAKYLGMRLTKVEKGFASGTVPMKLEHSNVYGGMHGGCAFAIADTLAGIAAVTYGHMVTTLDANFNYLEAIRDTKEVVCEARVVRHGGRITVSNVEIYDDKKRLVCNGSFTYYNIVHQSSAMCGLSGINKEC